MVTPVGLPKTGSEDFSYFLQERPGCYFNLGTGQPGMFIHQSNYDFNDSMIAYGGLLWVAWVKYRFT